ncbi:hypothetical protein IC229_28385 [Spirosoma sp. BT702]|uniref:Phosphatidate cytidylyltransferase n=1 Tax=Spirosoma profusum TaxID=2771354 RepID=A0A927ASY1_9BACT|nr:hypothetical protein [Spirosoma profusum]MBD2704593.1 hypothetical protein [Spirosoma profusum]
MKALVKFLPMALVAFFLTFLLSSCEVVGDIFQAGAWTGAILVILGIGIVIWLVSKLFGGGNS